MMRAEVAQCIPPLLPEAGDEFPNKSNPTPVTHPLPAWGSAMNITYSFIYQALKISMISITLCVVRVLPAPRLHLLLPISPARL